MALKLGGFVIMLMMSFINIIQEATKAPASHEDTTLIGQLVLLATFLVNIIVQLWRESRARKWQLADEANRKTELAQHETVMKQKLDEQTKELQASARTRVSDLGRNLDGVLADWERRQNERRDK